MLNVLLVRSTVLNYETKDFNREVGLLLRCLDFFFFVENYVKCYHKCRSSSILLGSLRYLLFFKSSEISVDEFVGTDKKNESS